MFTRRSLLRALALVPVALPALSARAAQPASSTPRITPKLIQEIEALAAKELSTFDVVGAALALIQDGEVVYAKGFDLYLAQSVTFKNRALNIVRAGRHRIPPGVGFDGPVGPSCGR